MQKKPFRLYEQSGYLIELASRAAQQIYRSQPDDLLPEVEKFAQELLKQVELNIKHNSANFPYYDVQELLEKHYGSPRKSNGKNGKGNDEPNKLIHYFADDLSIIASNGLTYYSNGYRAYEQQRMDLVVLCIKFSNLITAKQPRNEFVHKVNGFSVDSL